MPTGHDTRSDSSRADDDLFIATPSRDPAATTGTSGRSSQKRFRDAIARGHSWISSRNTRVLPFEASVPVYAEIAASRRSGSSEPANTLFITSLSRNVTCATASKYPRPNSRTSQVLPT